jgi:hypothetical protein
LVSFVIDNVFEKVDNFEKIAIIFLVLRIFLEDSSDFDRKCANYSAKSS